LKDGAALVLPPPGGGVDIAQSCALQHRGQASSRLLREYQTGDFRSDGRSKHRDAWPLKCFSCPRCRRKTSSCRFAWFQLGRRNREPRCGLGCVRDLYRQGIPSRGQRLDHRL